METLLLRFKEVIALRDDLQKQNADFRIQVSALTKDLSHAHRSIEHLKELQAKAERAQELAEVKLETFAGEIRQLVLEKAVLLEQLKQLQQNVSVYAGPALSI